MREFVERAGAELGLTIGWEGEGEAEVGRLLAVAHPEPGTPPPGTVIVRVDPAYFRPTEVETLLGDAALAREKLGWQPRTSFAELVREMAAADLDEARRQIRAG